MLEWDEHFGNCYGTPRAPVEQRLSEGTTVLLEIDINGARQVKAAMPEALLVFLLPPSLEELERRLRSRGTETGDALQSRLDRMHEELAAEPEFDEVVVNDDLGVAAGQLVELLSRP